MDGPSTSAAALKLEIARLTGKYPRYDDDNALLHSYPCPGVINRHKTAEHQTARPPSTGRPIGYSRSNVYVNPNYKPTPKPIRPLSAPPARPSVVEKPSSNAQKHDVVIGGVAFEASGRSLVRKDCASPTFLDFIRCAMIDCIPVAKSIAPAPARHPPVKPGFIRDKTGTMVKANRTYKPRTSRTTRPTGRNMTLNNTKRPYQSVRFVRTPSPVQTYSLPRSRRVSNRRKYLNKPCPRFTTTGTPPIPIDQSDPCTNMELSRAALPSRCLQPWPYMHVPARPVQDRHLLAIPAGELSEHR